MRHIRRKDPSIIGKFSNSKLDLSFNLPPENPEFNSSAVLPKSSKATGKLVNLQSQIQFPLKARKTSIFGNYQSEGDQPLPQVRVSFSKIYQLRKVCQKNPEQEVEDHYNGLLHSKRQRLSRIGSKDVKKVGQIYSPRSQSVGEPGFIRHQKGRKQKSRLLQSLKNSKYINFDNHDQGQMLQKSRRMKVKVVDYNCKFLESQELSKKQSSTFLALENSPYTKEEGTQSRVVAIEPVCITPQKQAESPRVMFKSCEVVLKDDGQNGYVQVNEQEDKKVEHPNDLKVLWQENYIEAENLQLRNTTFFLEEQYQKGTVTDVNFDLSLSELKIMLIQQGNQIKASFIFPDILLNTITQAISQPLVHQYAQKVFSAMRNSMNTQLISFKKFSNCILVTTKIPKSERKKAKAERAALLWYYSGRFYVGGWTGSYGESSEGYKTGMGLEYYPSNYIYYGTFGKNSRNGFGIMKKSTKEIYLGEWVNNKRQGWGKVFNYNGEMIFDGDFEEGRFTQNRTKTY